MARAADRGPQDAVIELGSRRTLGYATYGDPGGYPVINCHGGLVSRNDCALADRDARELGLRIISPDRPGIGLTDRLPGHGILDWAGGDLRDLVDSLELDRFSVMGWSAGGQHALAAAHTLGERIDRVAVVAGCVPVDAPAARSQLSALDQRLLRWTEKTTLAAKAYFGATRLLANRAPKRLVSMGAGELEGDEHGALTDHADRRDWFVQTMREGCQDVSGQVDDYRAFGAPWGFQPEDIEVPVAIHHGTKDALAPFAWGEELGRRIPNASLTTYEGVGHLIAVTRAREILESLAKP